MDQIVANRERELVHSMANAGDGEAIAKRFQMKPEHGGFSDLIADKDIFEETSNRVNELLESGAPNTWHSYAQAGSEIRAKYRTLGDPPDSFIQAVENHKTIAEMQARRMGGK